MSSSGSATARRISGTVASALRLPAVGLEQDRRGDLLMQPGLLDRVLGLAVEPQGVGILLARDVGRDRPFEVVVAELLEEGGAEVGVVQAGRSPARSGGRGGHPR